ncbi:MAG: SDR family NAD(P)-dependent oxidoreductase [Pseudomonadota bacterium]|nr:SDR family NAD(P)-dependent oxidoreductase [Pseudomonadota bacterium]
MEQALVIGASGGIGAAMVAELQARGVSVTALSRSVDGLDVTDEASVSAHLGALQGPYDLIFVATGALHGAGQPPEKTLKALDPAAMADQFAINCLGPAMVLKHALPLLPRQGRAVFAALSARVGSIGDNRLGGWISYRSAKAALNQVIHTAAIELARSHKGVICAALHPGTVATSFTENYAARHATVPPAQSAANLLQVMEALRPEDSGGFFDWQGTRVEW